MFAKNRDAEFLNVIPAAAACTEAAISMCNEFTAPGVRQRYCTGAAIHLRRSHWPRMCWFCCARATYLQDRSDASTVQVCSGAISGLSSGVSWHPKLWAKLLQLWSLTSRYSRQKANALNFASIKLYLSNLGVVRIIQRVFFIVIFEYLNLIRLYNKDCSGKHAGISRALWYK